MESTQLSIEQQFELRVFSDQVARMSHSQAQEMLIKLREHLMIRETTFKSMLKTEVLGDISSFRL